MIINDKTKESINLVLLDKIGLTYEEYMNLDISEQEMIITNNKLKYDDRLYVDGFPIGNIITKDEIDDKIISIIYKKPIALVKKLSKKIIK